MPSKAITIPRKAGKVIEPFQHPAPKLEMAPPSTNPWNMTPPSMSPLHMSPPNMLLPNFSPIQDHMPLPTLSASKMCPPQSFLTHNIEQPASVARFSRIDPTLLLVGVCDDDPDDCQPIEQESSILVFKVEDVEREVRGDREIVAGPANEVRLKIRPQLQEVAEIPTPAGVLDIQFSPHDTSVFAATFADGSLSFYRVRRGHTIRTLSTHTPARGSPIHSIAFSPTNPSIAALGLANGTAQVIQLPNRHKDDSLSTLATIPCSTARVLRVAFSADGRRLYTAGADGKLVSYSITKPAQPKQKWEDELPRGITALVPWPLRGSAEENNRRRTLITGCYDGTLRILDMSGHLRPPLILQSMELEGPIMSLSQFPPLPDSKYTKSLPAGTWSHLADPDKELDHEIGGLLAGCSRGGGRALIQKQKFEDVFLPRRDGSDIVDWTTSDGVKMDHEGREKQYWWYDLADIEEHGEGVKVTAGDAVAVVDYDPLFRDAGEQRKRRGWRLCSVDREGGMCFWQVYVE